MVPFAAWTMSHQESAMSFWFLPGMRKGVPMGQRETELAALPGEDVGPRPRFVDGPGILRGLARTMLEFGGVLLLAAPFFWLTARNYLRLDLWFDEILSLRRYILVPFMKTVTDYSSTNNHVFFNMLTRKALRLFGFRKLFPLLEEPWVLRSLMLVVSTTTLLVVYLVCRRFFGRSMGVLATVILATTVPFYNFAVQVRGYTLSMLLLCLLLFFVWSLEERLSVAMAAGATIVSAMMVYTIPLNLYPLGAVITCQGAFLIAHLIGRGSSPGESDRSWRTPFVIILSCAAGIGIAALLYLPLYSGMAKSRYLRPYTDFNTGVLFVMMPEIMRHFLSGRWALLLGLPFGIGAATQQARKGGGAALLKKYLLLCALLLLPFLFSFLRRDRVFERIFVNLAPVAALLLALNWHLAFGSIHKARKAISLILMVGIWAYSATQFATEVARKDRFLLEQANSTTIERKWDTLYGGYYQAGYRPREIVRLTKDFLARHHTPLPVFLAGELDSAVIPSDFLDNAGIEYQDLRQTKPQDYPAFCEALFLVTHPQLFDIFVKQQLPGTRCLMVNAEAMLANLYFCWQAPRSTVPDP